MREIKKHRGVFCSNLQRCRAPTLLSLVLVLHSSGSGAPVPAAAVPPPPFNVLMIIVDDLRTELGVYGAQHVASPNIDSLAARGVTFLRAYCQFSMCSPSRSSFLTGMRPDSTGVYDLASSFRDRLGPAAVTLPGYFKALGYATVGVGKVFHGELDDPEAWTEPWQPCNRPHYPPGRSWPHATRGTVEIGGLAAAAAAAAAATETRPTRASAATGHRSRAHGLTGLNASFTVKHTVSELLGAGGGAEPAMGSVEACHDDLDLVGCDAFRDHAIASAAVASLRKLAANAPKKLGRTPQATLEGGGWDETRRPPSMSRSSSSSSSGSGSPSSSIGSGSPSSSGERNFFLAVGFTKPHLPFVFPSKYWRLYDKGEQQTPVPLAPQPRRQKGAPPWAVELGAELFSFSDTAPLKKRAKQRLVTHNAAAAAAAAGRGAAKSIRDIIPRRWPHTCFT